MFQKAIKHESKLRLAIAGPSGGGKTYTALAIGTALAGNGRVAVIDTEHGSASKYADIFSFDTLNLRPPFHPDRFIDAIEAAGKSGYGVVIIDSLSHAWNGEGGLLEIVDEIGKRMKTANTFAAWKDATPIQNRMIEAIVGAEIHIIATMRSKQEYVLEQVERNGRWVSQPKKVGMAPVQRDSMEYEFDVYLDMDIDNNAIVQKTRCPALTGRVFGKPGADVAEILQAWLRGESIPSGRQNPDPTPRQPQPTQQAPQKQNNGATDVDFDALPSARAERAGKSNGRKPANGNGAAIDWRDKALAATSFSAFCSAASYALAQYTSDHHVRGVLGKQPDFEYDPANNEELLNWLEARKEPTF